MATFISLLNFTDQGIRDIKESPNRAEAFTGMASKLGLTVKSALDHRQLRLGGRDRRQR